MKTSKGLGWRRWADPIESFVREHGQLTPRWAVICTYECDMERLERDVLPLLSRRGRTFRTVVLADAGALQQRLKTGKTPVGRISLHPVGLLRGGVFHPKLVFLRAGNRVCVCFGSANVTSGGMGGNLELWADSDEPEIACAFNDFLHKLSRHDDIALDPPTHRALERALIGLGRCESALVWTSLDEPFTNRLKRKNSGLAVAKWVHLLSPAYASKGGAKAALKPFGGLRTTIYTDGAIAHGGAKLLRYDPPLPPDAESSPDEDDTSTPRPSKLHAKAYLFEGRNEGVLWFGSANLTAQALVRSVRKGGNVEILVKTRLPGTELRAFLTDLARRFPSSAATENGEVPPPEPRPTHRGLVLSGEIQERGGELRLIVHTIPGVRFVKLAFDRRIVRVAIKRRRGIVERVAHLIPELRLGRSGDNWSGVIYEEIADGVRIPVVVNMALVPEPSTDGRTAEDTVDDWIDELLGRWPPKPRTKDDPESSILDAEDQDDPMPEEEELRRLDEVDHQGALDRLAVKAAFVKKRITSAPMADGYREKLERAVADSIIRACEPHLRLVVSSWFPRVHERKGLR